MDIAKTLVEILSEILFKIFKRRTSLDKAFKYVLSKYRAEKYRAYTVLFYESAANLVNRFYTLTYIYCINKMKNYASLYDIINCVEKIHYSLKSLVRIWLCNYASEVVKSSLIIDSIDRYCRKRIENRLVEKLQLPEDAIFRLAFEYSYPIWFVNIIAKSVGIDAAAHLLRALNRPCTWLRINTLLADYDKILRMLEDEGVVYEIDKDLFYMVKVLESPKPVHELEVFKRRYVVTQDKASALVVEALDLDHGDVVADLCGAPGMKASLIMQLLENRGELILIDVSKERLLNSIALLKSLGVDISRVHFLLSDSSELYIRRVDKALIDAPCTDSGAIRRDPAIKIHLLYRDWAQSFASIQLKLLINALRLKPSVVVYATCSLLPWEGEGVVYNVSLREPLISMYELEKPKFGSYGYNSFYLWNRVTRLYPHEHDTQGFFIAKFVKIT